VAIRRLIDLAATCVFAKQSLGPILCGLVPLRSAWDLHVPEAPLLPKLRGHFAEFLLHGSLEHLRLLASPTCVGFRYGRTGHSRPRLFLAASLENPWPDLTPALGIRSHLKRGLFFPLQATPLHRDSNPRRSFCFRVPPDDQTHPVRHGNLDPFPIAYASRPRLRGRLTRSG
jgi:hypothetical protein